MKYLVVLCDGMADYPIEELGNKTPLEAAITPNMDKLAAKSEVGLVKTVADGLKPGSDVANLSVLGYDPDKYYTGRSPLEAGSIGIDMLSDDIAIRCNLVTLSTGETYEDRTLVDYCADDISTAEGQELVAFLQEKLGNDEFRFYGGVSYRHCLIWHHGSENIGWLTPPHDITGRCVREYVPAQPDAAPLYDLMKKSYDLLTTHPINLARIDRGLRPANSIWLWGDGKRADLPNFYEKYGVKASMISAVDLLKGIGKFSGMNVVFVDGATGYIDTDFDAKAQAAIDEFKNGQDFVYIHVEAPDECGHRNETKNKVRSIELIDEKILAKLIPALNEMEEPYRIMILPDHPTPLSLRTHTNDPVPYLIYTSNQHLKGTVGFSESIAEATGHFVDTGYTLMDSFLLSAPEE